MAPKVTLLKKTRELSLNIQLLLRRFNLEGIITGTLGAWPLSQSLQTILVSSRSWTIDTVSGTRLPCSLSPVCATEMIAYCFKWKENKNKVVKNVGLYWNVQIENSPSFTQRWLKSGQILRWNGRWNCVVQFFCYYFMRLCL